MQTCRYTEEDQLALITERHQSQHQIDKDVNCSKWIIGYISLQFEASALQQMLKCTVTVRIHERDMQLMLKDIDLSSG